MSLANRSKNGQTDADIKTPLVDQIQVLLFNTYDWGGAGIATRRLAKSLNEIDINAELLVRHSRSDHPNVTAPTSNIRRAYNAVRLVADSKPTRLYGGTKDFSIGWLPDRLHTRINQIAPDIVHLNWVGDGGISLKTIGKIDVPIVWRLPDMWAFTGGCHYARDCQKYQETCGACPQLHSRFSYDISRWVWRTKRKAWDNADITVVATSSWLAKKAASSSLFSNRRIEVIPNALDTDTYRPVPGVIGRQLFDIPDADHIVLFGAQQSTSNPRKGFDLLVDAIASLDTTDIHLVVFGGREPDEGPNFDVPTSYVGYLEDDQSLAVLYSMADVMVTPSRYEGFGQTVSEALACETPVVAFSGSGPEDIIDHKETGFLATPHEAEDLAAGIEWILEDGKRRGRLGKTARERAIERYSMTTVAAQYGDLFRDLIEEANQ